MPIFISIYNISKSHTLHKNAEDLSLPMIYHTMLYTQYQNYVRWSATVVGRSPDKRGPIDDWSAVLKTMRHSSLNHRRRVADLIKTS